jgi:hypothetical protein
VRTDEEHFTTRDVILLFPLWTFHLYVATFQEHLLLAYIHVYEEFEDIKGVIRIRKSKMDRQRYCQKKKDKRANNDLSLYDIANDPMV